MKKRRYLSQDQADEMLRRYSAGTETVAAIAADYGVDQTYPGLLAKRRGIPLRDPKASTRLREARSGAAR